MEFEQILESMSEMEKKYYYSLNEDDKTQYILKKMEEVDIKGMANTAKAKLSSQNIAGTGKLDPKAQAASTGNTEISADEFAKMSTDEVEGIIKEYENQKVELEKAKEKASPTEKRQLTLQIKEIDNAIADAKADLQKSIKNVKARETRQKNKDAKAAADARNKRVSDGQNNSLIRKAFGEALGGAFIKYQDDPVKLNFLLNTTPNSNGKLDSSKFNPLILKILDKDAQISQKEAESLMSYFSKSGYNLPYSAEQIAGANDLSAYNSSSKVYQKIKNDIEKDLKEIKRLAGEQLKRKKDVASIFENIDLSEVDGDIIYEGLFDAISKPMNAASNLVGNIVSAPFDLANSIFNGGKSLGKAAVSGTINAIKNKHMKNVANKPLKQAQKAQAKAAKQAQKAQNKAAKEASINAQFGPIPEFQNLLSSAKNLNDINAAIPKFIENLETYFYQLGVDFDISRFPSIKVYRVKNKEPLDFSEFFDVVNGDQRANFKNKTFKDILAMANDVIINDELEGQQTQPNKTETQTQGKPAASQSQQTNTNQSKNLDDGTANKGNSKYEIKGTLG